MKISPALLILLLAAAWTGSQGMSFLSYRVTCCSKKDISRKKIPEVKIQDYQYTASLCPHKAVLVKLPKAPVCVDPKAKWFQDYERKKKQPNSTST